MQLLHACLKSDRKGGLAAAGLILVLIAAGAAGFVVVFQNDYVKVEARIYDVDWSKDPIAAKVDVRVTNLASEQLEVQRFVVTVWADAGRTVVLSSAELAGVSVAPGESSTFTVPVEIRNADHFGGRVWVDLEASWAIGGIPGHESVVGREISVGAELGGGAVDVGL